MCVIVVVINGVRVVSLGSRGFLFLSSRVICMNVLYSCYDRVVVVFCSVLARVLYGRSSIPFACVGMQCRLCSQSVVSWI